MLSTNKDNFEPFYNTQMIKGSVKPVVKEILIGHKAIGLESNYYRPTDDELVQEYLKAIDYLTISTERKLRMENEELQSKLQGETKMNAELEQLRKMASSLEQDIHKMEQKEFEAMAKERD